MVDMSRIINSKRERPSSSSTPLAANLLFEISPKKSPRADAVELYDCEKSLPSASESASASAAGPGASGSLRGEREQGRRCRLVPSAAEEETLGMLGGGGVSGI